MKNVLQLEVFSTDKKLPQQMDFPIVRITYTVFLFYFQFFLIFQNTVLKKYLFLT